VDGGATFEPPVEVPSNPQWGTMDVAPDGRVFLAGVARGDPAHVLVARSSTAREAGQAVGFDFVRAVDLGGTLRAGLGLDSPNPDGFLGQVWIAVDPSSGPTAGWVYVLASVDPPGDDPMDVMFARSTDGGWSWSAPRRVHRDAPLAWQWFGTLSVSPHGRLDVVWNDTRGSTDPRQSRLYYTVSMDGGSTWAPDLAVSPAWDSHAGWPVQRKIGDYYHLVSDRVGANLAWAATFRGGQDVWFQRLGPFDCNGNDVADEQDLAQGTSLDRNANAVPDECEDDPQTGDVANGAPGAVRLRGVPNPFQRQTAIAVLPPAAGRVRLDLLDVAGRCVRTVMDFVPREGGSVPWDGRDAAGRRVPAGVYVCRLVEPRAAAAAKLVVLE
jgi:hypothetical protein